VYELKEGQLVLLYRDNRRSHRIYRAFSDDHGRTWTNPIPTDFPDQTAKFSVLRLTSGPYLLVSNPRPAEERFPLTVSFSDDGIVFDRIATVIAELPGARFPNFTKRPGAQYPHAIEAAGSVLIAYSVNQESIQVVMIPRDRLARGQGFR
jgi:predicted neuraminidase